MKKVIIGSLVVLFLFLLILGAAFGVISYSFMSTEWATNPDVFRSGNARAGFGVLAFILGVVWLFATWCMIGDSC